jgi:hypothetical protein
LQQEFSSGVSGVRALVLAPQLTQCIALDVQYLHSFATQKKKKKKHSMCLADSTLNEWIPHAL